MKPLDILNQPFALPSGYLRELIQIYGAHVRGEKVNFKALEEALALATGQPRDPQPYQVENGVAIIPIKSVMTKETSLFSFLFGGTSTARARMAFNSAIADASVQAVVLHIDSPGGSVDGTQELAQAIYAARGKKPIVAFADGMMASAAYWTGSAADAVFMSSDTTVMGSIGVVTAHVDVSRAEEAFGVKVTEITAGEFKRITSSHAPLSEPGRAYIQADLDHIYGVFLEAVGTYRGGLDPQQVHEQMANGRTFRGQLAIKAGLADGVSSLSDLVQRLSQGAKAMDLMKPAAVSVQADHNPNAAGAAAEPPTSQEEQPMNIEKLKAEHPEVFKAAVELGKSEAETGLSDKLAAAKAEGADAERARIQGVLGVNLRGHEALVQTLAFDGKTTPEQAAFQVNQAEQKVRTKAGDDLRADAPKPAPHSVEDPNANAGKQPEPDPHVVAQKAREFQDAEAAGGRTVSISEAVTHIRNQMTKKEA